MPRHQKKISHNRILKYFTSRALMPRKKKTAQNTTLGRFNIERNSIPIHTHLPSLGCFNCFPKVKLKSKF